MKLKSKSIQRSWDKLESFFKPSLVQTPSLRPSSSNIRTSANRSLVKSPSKLRKNSITESNIPGVTNTQLEQLYYAKCSDLQIPIQKDNKSKFFIYCSTHFLCKELRLTAYSLGVNSGKILNEILNRNNFFAYVKLGKNILGDEGIKNLLQGIINNQVIVHLDLSNNNITPEGSIYLLKSLSNHSTIYSLNLASTEALHKNKLGKQGGQEIEKYLVNNGLVGVLNLYGTGVGESISEITRGIEHCKSLVSLNIGGNFLGPADIKLLMQGVRKSNILILDLSENSIGNEGCVAIADLIASEFVLEQLYLRGNGIGFKGCKEVFSALYSNFYLKRFDISMNPIQYLPRELAYSLENNISLKEFNFSACMLRKEAISVIGKLLLKNRGIDIMNLSSNYIEDDSIPSLCSAISRNSNIKSVNLSKNRIKNQGARLIAEALKINQSLTDINLRENGIKDLGAEELVESTRTNRCILKLNLDLNSVGSKILEKINKNLKNNFETNNKLIPIRVRNQLASIDYNKNSFYEVNQKVLRSKKEKEDILSRIGKQHERFDEAKQIEIEKFEEIHKELLKVKGKNFDLAIELESLTKNMVKFIIEII